MKKRFQYARSVGGQVILGSTVTVDTFLVISGALTVFAILKHCEYVKFSNVPLMYFHRYLR